MNVDPMIEARIMPLQAAVDCLTGTVDDLSQMTFRLPDFQNAITGKADFCDVAELQEQVEELRNQLNRLADEFVHWQKNKISDEEFSRNVLDLLTG